jgi:hypothetical protein
MNALVYDGTGRLIKSIGELSSDNYNSMAVARVDLTSVASGKYYLVLTNNERKLTKPFIIM